MTPDDMEFGEEPEFAAQPKPAVPAEVIGQGADQEAAAPKSSRAPSRPAPEHLTHNTPAATAHPPLHDRAAEAHVLSCLLLDPASPAPAPDAFYFPEHRLLLLSIQRLLAQGKPVELATISADLSDRQQFDQMGGWPFLFEIENRTEIPTTLHLRHYLDRITDLAHRRQAKAHAEETLRALALGKEPPAVLQVEKPQAPASLKARLPSSFAYVPASHESVLIGNRYLSRGDGSILVSTSGMGKSSLGFTLAGKWALGLPFLGGFQPRVALKTLIVQSEDGDGDVAEVYHSFVHANALTPAQLTQLDQNLRILTDRVHRGAALITELKRQIALFQPDIIIINPLLAFMDGDLNSAEDAGRFLREQLNSLNEPARFAYLIIHHTSKPPKEKTERRWNEVMYDMAGSGDLTNWARAIISLRPLDEEGHFELNLSKRGKRAGFTKAVEQGAGTRHEPIAKIGLRHASAFFRPPGAPNDIPLIHWEAADLPTEASKSKNESQGGRPEKYPFDEYAHLLPKKQDAGKPFNEMLRILMAEGVNKTSVQGVLKRWAASDDLEVVRRENGPTLYRRAL